MTTPPDPDRVLIFDTTLRDGEQSPGIGLNTAEKLEIAHQLARLGVDVIEAGFPIASPGDFEAVRAIAREVARSGRRRAGARQRRPTSSAPGRRCARPRGRASTRSSRPRTSTSSTSCRPRARTSRAWPAPPSRRRKRATPTTSSSRPMDATRADPEFTAEVLQIAIDEGATTINVPDTVGYAMPQEYAALPRPALRPRARPPRRRPLGPLPRRPRAGRRELLRRRPGRRAPGRVRDQRHRRARRQRVAGGARDAPAHAPRRHGPATRRRSRRRSRGRAGSSRA